jgi:hypothetical protein
MSFAAEKEKAIPANANYFWHAIRIVAVPALVRTGISALPLTQRQLQQKIKSEGRSKNGARGMSDIEAKAAHGGSERVWATNEFQ